MLMLFFFSPDFLYKSMLLVLIRICLTIQIALTCGAIQMSTNNICFYKEVVTVHGLFLYKD